MSRLEAVPVRDMAGGPSCFYESTFVKRVDRRQSSQIVLVQVASGILRWTNGERSRKRSVFKDASVLGSCFCDPLAALGSGEGNTFHKLLSVLVEDQTPNDVCARRKKLFRSDPIYTSVPRMGDPHGLTGRAHQLAEKKNRDYISIEIRQASIEHLAVRCPFPRTAKGRSRVCGPTPQCQCGVPGCHL